MMRATLLGLTFLIAGIGSMMPGGCNGLSPSYRLNDSTILGGADVTRDNDTSSLPAATQGTSVVNRRNAALKILAPMAMAMTAAGIQPANAFDNGIPEMENYKDRTKFPGTPPVPLGLRSNGKLSLCDDGLNCFSTSGDEGHQLEMWRAPKGGATVTMGDLLETIKAYPPGQSRVDKGGFSIVTSNPDYLYVQFESMKHGFIDDLEFAVDKNGREVQVRSSSRIGNLDLGVNAKRLNWISARLRAKGWKAPEITQDDYPDYFNTLVFTFDDYIRSVLGPEDCPVPAEPLQCKNPRGIKF